MFEEAEGLYLLFVYKPVWRYYPVEITEFVFYQFCSKKLPKLETNA
jgi:hypothetical protein